MHTDTPHIHRYNYTPTAQMYTPVHTLTQMHTHAHTRAHVGPKAAGFSPFSSVSPMPGAGDAR